MPSPHAPRRRALAGLALAAVTAVTAIGIYAETIRVPDQP